MGLEMLQPPFCLAVEEAARGALEEVRVSGVGSVEGDSCAEAQPRLPSVSGLLEHVSGTSASVSCEGELLVPPQVPRWQRL